MTRTTRVKDRMSRNLSESLNRATLVGNLGATPILRVSPNGHSFIKLQLATNETYKDDNGKEHERTEWHHIAVWGPRAEGLARFLRKGMLLLVEGPIRTRKFPKRGGGVGFAVEIDARQIVVSPTTGQTSCQCRQTRQREEPPPET